MKARIRVLPGRLTFGLKLVATAVVAYLLAVPFLHPQAERGILGEVEALGRGPVAVVVLTFLGLVALYCRSLQRCLALVRPSCRAAAPRSVWLMFLLPYNFVEDFFIVHHVAQSIRAEAALNTRLSHLRRYGAFSGFGWCAAQIVSLWPSQVGAAAGFVALPLWLWHWLFVIRVNRRLAGAAT